MRSILVLGSISLIFAAASVFAKKPKTNTEKASYSMGHNFGQSMKAQSVELSLDHFIEGLRQAMAGKPSAVSPEEAQKVMNEFRQTVQKKHAERMKKEGENNLKKGKAFLATNKKKKGIVALPSGLQYKIEKAGTGAKPKASDTVVTHYTGTLIDGTKFDSSHDRKQPARFRVDGVIKGWTEALQLMKTGAKWKLYIPADLAYGPQGRPPKIGPNSTLLFDIELIEIAKAPAKKGTAKK